VLNIFLKKKKLIVNQQHLRWWYVPMLEVQPYT